MLKAAIIVFVLALAISCLMNSSPYPSYPGKVGIMNIGEMPEAAGTSRQESVIPDMKMTDGYRGSMFMTRVGDTAGGRSTDFPWPQMQ